MIYEHSNSTDSANFLRSDAERICKWHFQKHHSGTSWFESDSLQAGGLRGCGLLLRYATKRLQLWHHYSLLPGQCHLDDAVSGPLPEEHDSVSETRTPTKLR